MSSIHDASPAPVAGTVLSEWQPASSPRRERLLSGWTPAEAVWAQRMAALLLAQDGSATRLCELAAGGPVELVVHSQRSVTPAQVPEAVRALLPGAVLIERLVSLQAHGEVMMDNLSWLAPEALPADIRAELAAGRTPIGHLLARLWIRRVSLPSVPELSAALWDSVGLPDASATRSYAVHVPDAGAAMVITECFRHGMWMTPSVVLNTTTTGDSSRGLADSNPPT